MFCQLYTRVTIPSVRGKQELKEFKSGSILTQRTTKRCDSTNLIIRTYSKTNKTENTHVKDKLVTARQLANDSNVVLLSNSLCNRKWK